MKYSQLDNDLWDIMLFLCYGQKDEAMKIMTEVVKREITDDKEDEKET